MSLSSSKKKKKAAPAVPPKATLLNFFKAKPHVVAKKPATPSTVDSDQEEEKKQDDMETAAVLDKKKQKSVVAVQDKKEKQSVAVVKGKKKEKQSVAVVKGKKKEKKSVVVVQDKTNKKNKAVVHEKENKTYNKYPVGTRVKKFFSGDGWFRGKVTSIEEDGLYRVTYDDNDVEDYSETELETILDRSNGDEKPAASNKKLKRKDDDDDDVEPPVKMRSSPRAKKRQITYAESSDEEEDSDGIQRPSATNKKRSSSRSNKRRITYEESESEQDTDDFEPQDDDDDESMEDEVTLVRPKNQSSSRKTSAPSTNALLESSDEEDSQEEKTVQPPSKKTRPSKPATLKSADDTQDSKKKAAQPPLKKPKTGSAWGSLVSCKSAPKKTKRAPTKAKKTATKKTSGGKFVKAPYTDGDDLPIISTPQAMFDDMISVQLTDNGTNADVLIPMLKKLHKRPLRVATMCSGTESPVLALDMLSKALEDFYHEHKEQFGDFQEPLFQMEHVFSCEIEPFKQAYIERSFHPPLLFRDIRELGSDQAYTAYGALADVPCKPGDVHMLIAGTSCVDYSNLNGNQKTITDSGESGQTWRGMINWIIKAQPAICILENVYSAPWDKMVQDFETLGYYATFSRLDTKQYYIPHTRQRGYMFAIKKESSVGRGVLSNWQDTLKKLQRPASAALDAFMLPDDDPRVLRGRARLSLSTPSEKEVNWSRCEARHLYARDNEELGDKRPLTGWSESGSTSMPAFAWGEWMANQVHRIHDLVDISTLRCAVDGIDPTYKTMVWNLSQNVDRDTMGRLGLCQCLTPNGVPFVTNRGGPLVGEEVLLLQGIPADDLLLTKETEDQLKDLAGNAMSTTVVGACMLSALLHGHGAILPAGKETSHSSGSVVPTLVPRPLALASSGIKITRSMAKYSDSVLRLEPREVSREDDDMASEDFFRQLLRESVESRRMCVTEGGDLALPFSSLLQCKSCGFTASKECNTPVRKYEEHEFVEMDASGMTRMDPAAFRKKLLDVLPMRVELVSFNLDDIIKPSGIDNDLWDGWKDAVNIATSSKTSSEGARISEEYRFSRLQRSHIWTAYYSALGASRLELQLSQAGAVWLLFAQAPPQKGPLKEALDRPIARMKVNPAKNMFTGGDWEVCLPKTSSVNLSIEGVGREVDSWRAKLGLKGEFESEVRYERLKISVQNNDCESLREKIDGEYDLLSKCGGACGSLHKRARSGESNVSGSAGSDVFFFLESGRCSVGSDDSYVFSHSKHRTGYGEYRDTLLRIDPAANYRTEFQANHKRENSAVRALISGEFVQIDGASLQHVSSRTDATIRFPLENSLRVSLSPAGWKNCPEILSCELPLAESDGLYEECNKLFSRDGQSSVIEVNLQKSRGIFDNLAFATSRLSIPEAVSRSWLALERSGLEIIDGEEVSCNTCSPFRPAVKWTMVTTGKKVQIKPIEDGKEAAGYERAMKRRPNPWLVTLSQEKETNRSKDSFLKLQIGCNAVSLVYRALGLFPRGSFSRRAMLQLARSKKDESARADCIFEWRIIPHVDKSLQSGDFPTLYLTSNKKDKPAAQPPGFDELYPLRPEQLRSLAWMLAQEASATPFFEEEVTEAVLPSLNWRAEGRVKRPVLVRGGIVADEVGYGKTAITLGLIAAAPKANGPPPDAPVEFKDTTLRTNATLVIVPTHLMGQWPQEIKKFMGSKKRVCEIKDMTSFNKLTVKDISEAEIVVVNFNVLSGEKYFERLACFAGVNISNLPKGGRHFDHMYKECLSGVGKRVSSIKEDCSTVFGEIQKDADRKLTDDSQIRLDGKKAVYKNLSEDQVKAVARTEGEMKKKSVAVKDTWGLRTPRVKKDFKEMSCPPLEMFYWCRIVVDEFHYLAEKADRARVHTLVLGLKSSYRWCLSGTPPHLHFKDIQTLASLLGVHLGVEDILPDASLKKKRGGSQDDKTDMEKFSSLLEIRSLQWHERRHQVAQNFLNRFLRQNIAEIDEIKYEEFPIVIDLPPAERAIYLELKTYVDSLEMNGKKALKSKKSSGGDREDRMQRIIEGSDTPEEALLKRCAHFNMSSEPATALETCNVILSDRENEKADCEKELLKLISAALRQRHRILELQPDWRGRGVTSTEMGKGEVQDRLELFIVDVEKKNSITGGADEEIHQTILDTLRKAQDTVENNPTDFDKFVDEYFDDDDDDDENTTGKGKKKKKRKRTPADDEEHLHKMKFALREHMHKVRSCAKELRGRMQSLRFFRWVRNFQLEETELACPGRGCQSSGAMVPREQLGVLSSCGHVGCMDCLHDHADKEKCIDPTCQVPVRRNDVASAVDFGVDRESGGQYGAKLKAIVDKVRTVVRDGDRVIVFVQFDDLKQKVSEALLNRGVKSLQVTGRVQEQTKTIDILQKETPDKDDPRVLLLTMDNESSAGVNLTTCNHAVFVHPLLADSVQQYKAYETQAIGRLRRYGQTKKVHIWRYFARETIDTEIYEERTGSRLCRNLDHE